MRDYFKIETMRRAVYKHTNNGKDMVDKAKRDVICEGSAVGL